MQSECLTCQTAVISVLCAPGLVASGGDCRRKVVKQAALWILGLSQYPFKFPVLELGCSALDIDIALSCKKQAHSNDQAARFLEGMLVVRQLCVWPLVWPVQQIC